MKRKELSLKEAVKEPPPTITRVGGFTKDLTDTRKECLPCWNRRVGDDKFEAIVEDEESGQVYRTPRHWRAIL